MAQKNMTPPSWAWDLLLRSKFFHEKLHEWKMVALYEELSRLPAATWEWDVTHLGISQEAWKKVVHAGIRPILVFAHPETLCQKPSAVSYYRMLAMISQKAMKNIGLPVERFEKEQGKPTSDEALRLARQFNQVISQLIEDDSILDERELWLWRGMAAGTQAQGSWQNAKGVKQEEALYRWLVNILREMGWKEDEDGSWVAEQEQLRLVFGSDPDLRVLRRQQTVAAVEIKGGIDPAGVLERIGAAVKTLQRIKDEHPSAVTLLVLPESAITETAQKEIYRQRQVINAFFVLEELLHSTKLNTLTENQRAFLQYLHLL